MLTAFCMHHFISLVFQLLWSLASLDTAGLVLCFGVGGGWVWARGVSLVCWLVARSTAREHNHAQALARLRAVDALGPICVFFSCGGDMLCSCMAGDVRCSHGGMSIRRGGCHLRFCSFARFGDFNTTACFKSTACFKRNFMELRQLDFFSVYIPCSIGRICGSSSDGKGQLCLNYV